VTGVGVPGPLALSAPITVAGVERIAPASAEEPTSRSSRTRVLLNTAEATR
jgi:hypothetical protein